MRNLGQPFNRMPEDRNREFAELEKRLAEEAKIKAEYPEDDLFPLSNYIDVGIKGLNGYPVLISKFEIPGTNNLNYEGTHKFLWDRGLYMPTIKIFTTHFTNIIKANNKERTLYDGNGKEIERKEIENIYNLLTGKEKTKMYSSWLNAKFIEGSGFDNLDLEQIFGVRGQNFIKSTFPLGHLEHYSCCLKTIFDQTGFPTIKSDHQDPQPGKNIFFFRPEKGNAAAMCFYPRHTTLDCTADPNQTTSDMFSFGCTEIQKEPLW